MNGYDNEHNPSKPIVRNAIPEKNGNLAVISLVCGILGLIGCWAFLWNVVFSIAGLITGIISLSKKHNNKTMAIVGTVISAIALLIGIIACIAYVLLLSVA